MPEQLYLPMEGIQGKIIIKHSRIEIHNYNLGDSSYLEYLFSVFDPIRHERFAKGAEYDYDRKILMLPRGMNIEVLKRIFCSEPYVDRNHDPMAITEPLPIRYLTKDERQLKILKFITGQDEYSYTLTKSQLSVNSTTGSGKTFVTVAAMCLTGSRVMIITSSTNWLRQWKDKIMEYTQLTDKDIFMLIGSSSIDKILSRDPRNYQIFLASHATLQSYGNNHCKGWYAIDELFKHLRISMKVFDEAHLYFDNMSRIDFHSNTRKTLYLTATPARSAHEEDVVYQEYFRNVPAISLFDENTDPHVNYIGMLYNSEPTPDEVRSFSVGQFNFDRNIYTSYLVGKPNFLKMVTILIDMTLKIPGKVLIYIGVNACIDFVRDYIVKEFPFLKNHIGIYNSVITDREARKRMLMKKFILSTTKSCGAASDIANLAVTIVLAEPFKSSVTARQTLGRCRADNTLYIDCVDFSCYRTREYYQKKKAVFNMYAKSCKEIFLDADVLEQRYQAAKANYNIIYPAVQVFNY